MARKVASNTFEKGLMMDLNPMTTPNNVLTSALNATILTFNGSEYMLQTDMGNGRVETACLPQGFVPVGIAEFGGIIYVVSYNPFIDKSQIGSFPSPERNISSEDINKNILLSNSDFGFSSSGATTFYVQKNLYEENLSPGDKYVVYTRIGSIRSNHDSLWDCYTDEPNAFNSGGQNVTKAVKLSFATITDEGKIVKLTNLKTFSISGGGTYIIPEMNYNPDGMPNLDSYRSLVSSPYNIFNSKVSGKLLIVAELVTIDDFSVSASCVFVGEDSAKTKDVEIYMDMSYSSDLNVFLYGVNAEYEITDEGSSKASLRWTNTTIESNTKIDDNRIGDAKLCTVRGYDYINRPEKNVEFTIIPCMTFGPIKYLQKSGIIQLDKIGTGYIELYEWRYYIDNSNIMINWALQSYPEEGYEIAGVTFIMSCYNRNGEIETIKYSVSKKKSYNGSFMETIPFESEYFKIADNKTLLKNRLYYVTVEVQYRKIGTDDAGRYKYFHRWLYTAPIFNRYYLEGELSDFVEIKPDINLDCNIDYEFKKLKSEQQPYYIGNVSVEDPNQTETVDSIESMSTKTIYSEYYLSGKITPFNSESYGLLKLDESSANIIASLNNENKNVTFEDYVVTSINGDSNIMADQYLELKENKEWDGSIPEFPEDKKDSGKLVDDPYNYGIYIDGEFTDKSFTGDKAEFGENNSITIKTIEFIKVFSDLSREKITYNGTMRPAAYNAETFELYNMKTEGNHFILSTSVAYCQFEPGGKDGRDWFSVLSENGFGDSGRGRKGDNLSTTINDEENVNAIADIWAPVSGPIACAIWTQNYTNKESCLGMPSGAQYNKSWKFWITRTDQWHCERVKNAGMLDYRMAVHVLWKGVAEKQFKFINMATRIGQRSDGSANGNWGCKRLVFDKSTVAGGMYSLCDIIASILMQLYIYTAETVSSYFWIPNNVYYINKIITNFNIVIKYKINTSESTSLIVDTDNDSKIKIDKEMRYNLYDANHAIVANQENDDIEKDKPDTIDNNITFSFITGDKEVSASISTLNTGSDLANVISDYMETKFPAIAYSCDGSAVKSSIEGNPSKLYYIDNEGVIKTIDSGFKLYKIKSFDFSGDSYKAVLDKTYVISDSNSSYSNKFVVEDGIIYLNDNVVGQTIRCQRRNQDGTGGEGWVGKWNTFAPVKDLKLFN